MSAGMVGQSGWGRLQLTPPFRDGGVEGMTHQRARRGSPVGDLCGSRGDCGGAGDGVRCGGWVLRDDEVRMAARSSSV